MNGFFTQLLSDKKGGAVFNCFDLSHFLYIGFFVALAAILYFCLRNKDAIKREKAIGAVLNIAVGLYAADFFLMPLAYGVIHVEKLPFHICTAMCVLCFLSRHLRFFRRYKLQFATFGFICNLVYLIYPAGVMWHEIHPLSYRVIQTLSFHGIMMVYGFLVLCFEKEDFSWKKIYRDAVVIVCMTLWAIMGNQIYNTGEQVMNWFFVVQDPFGMFPIEIAQFIMPPLNIVLFFVAAMLVYLIFMAVKKTKK